MIWYCFYFPSSDAARPKIGLYSEARGRVAGKVSQSQRQFFHARYQTFYAAVHPFTIQPNHLKNYSALFNFVSKSFMYYGITD